MLKQQQRIWNTKAFTPIFTALQLQQIDYNFKKNFNISRTDVNLIIQEEMMKAIKFQQQKQTMQPKKIYAYIRIMTKHIYKSLLITDSKPLPATAKV